MSCHVLADRFTFAWEQVSSKVRKQVTIQQVVSREAFWHVFCQTPITEGDFKCVLARNCERLNSYENRIFHRRKLRRCFLYCIFLLFRNIGCFSHFLCLCQSIPINSNNLPARCTSLHTALQNCSRNNPVPCHDRRSCSIRVFGHSILVQHSGSYLTSHGHYSL